MSAESRLVELGLTLPPLPSPIGTYVHAVRAGNLLFLAGKGPRTSDGPVPTGKRSAVTCQRRSPISTRVRWASSCWR